MAPIENIAKKTKTKTAESAPSEASKKSQAKTANEKKTKLSSTKSSAKVQNVELVVETVEVSPDVVKGRSKRKNAQSLDTITESPEAKRGKKQVDNNQEVVNPKRKGHKRAAFPQKSKNTVSDNGTNAIEEYNSPQPSSSKAAAAKQKPQSSAVEKLQPVQEKRVKRQAAENAQNLLSKMFEKRKKEVDKVGKKEENEDNEPQQKLPSKNFRKKEVDAKPETAVKKPKLNATETNYANIDFTTDKKFNMKICSFNVAGLRAFVDKGGHKYFEHELPNIICLQVGFFTLHCHCH